MLIDAHTHLNGEILFDQREYHLKNFEKIWGKILINSGANTFYNQNAISIAKKAKTLFPNLTTKATIGFSPHDIEDLNRDDFTKLISDLEQQYLHNQDEIIAIGECGIDLHWTPWQGGSPDGCRGGGLSERGSQQTLFKLQAELAKKLNLPLVVHSRDAFEETIEVLKNFTDLKIYFHCRGYWPKEIQKTEKLLPQVRFGFTNIISYPNAKQTRESLLTAKKTNLLLETDAPFLPPQTLRWKINYPEYITHVYEQCAEILEIEQKELKKLIETNFRRLFEVS